MNPGKGKTTSIVTVRFWEFSRGFASWLRSVLVRKKSGDSDADPMGEESRGSSKESHPRKGGNNVGVGK